MRYWHGSITGSHRHRRRRCRSALGRTPAPPRHAHRPRHRAECPRGGPGRQLPRSVAAAPARANAPVVPNACVAATAKHDGYNIGLARVSTLPRAPPHTQEPDALCHQPRHHLVRLQRCGVRPLGPAPARGPVRHAR
ncbi:hypothetical protein BS78_04G142700 [Paspalum vaginatum]|nr:hypothetical protein BS78_04G142700 [Paspalum vaginatum]